jgi:hypothetical protein
MDLLTQTTNNTAGLGAKLQLRERIYRKKFVVLRVSEG